LTHYQKLKLPEGLPHAVQFVFDHGGLEIVRVHVIPATSSRSPQFTVSCVPGPRGSPTACIALLARYVSLLRDYGTVVHGGDHAVTFYGIFPRGLFEAQAD
jgi:hypothetical protein